jgi:ABC-2 type transport system permease protein
VTTKAFHVDQVFAFVRRDFKINWSYRAAFFGDILSLITQIVMFYFIGLMVDPSVIPEYGGRPTSYIAFAAIGIALGGFLQLGLGRVSSAIRQEQLMGTLEPLFMTPTSLGIIQVGLAFYDLLYVPIRTAIFLGAVALFLDLEFAVSGALPTLVVILFFMPFVWGLGTLASAGIMTFKRGGAAMGVVVLALNVTSGAYFPLDLFPTWVTTLAQANPIAVAYQVSRETLLGGAGWEAVIPHIPFMALSAAGTLLAGLVAVRLALKREHRRGTLGAY